MVDAWDGFLIYKNSEKKARPIVGNGILEKLIKDMVSNILV